MAVNLKRWSSLLKRHEVSSYLRRNLYCPLSTSRFLALLPPPRLSIWMKSRGVACRVKIRHPPANRETTDPKGRIAALQGPIVSSHVRANHPLQYQPRDHSHQQRRTRSPTASQLMRLKLPTGRLEIRWPWSHHSPQTTRRFLDRLGIPVI